MPPTTSREVLNIGDSESNLTFGRRNGFVISRSAALGLAVFFVAAVASTGLLAYFLAPTGSDAGEGLDIFASSLKPAEPERPTTTPPTTTTTTTLIPSITAEDLRLPSTIKPMHYILHLQPLINGNLSIIGDVEIEIEVLEATNVVTLHILDIETANETIVLRPSDDPSASISFTSHVYDSERQFYIGTLEQELEVGKNYKLFMKFTGFLNDKLAGFYRSAYTDEEGNEKLLAITQFEATDARRAFPCFDEPGMKSTFQVFLAREELMSSLSNMPLTQTVPIEGQSGWVWDEFQTTVPMSTYLVAFAVSDFVYLDSNENDHVLFRVWARKGAIDQADYAIDKGPEVLTYYEDYFKIPFPLPKQDMIAIPDFSAGAMENWGLITYRETALLLDQATASASNKQRVAVVIAHELAHQWFGNLVSPKWWSDLWLNEGFAAFMEYKGTNAIEPDWQMLDQYLIILHSVFKLDSLQSSHPISTDVNNPSEIDELFDGISYDKGASIIRMMNFFMTEETFRSGVSNYLSALKYDNAEQDDLWGYLTTQAHTDGTLPDDLTVKTIMDTWTLQMGFPVLMVSRNSDNTATLSQKRFLQVEDANSTDTHDYKWWIPLSFTDQSSPDFEATRPKEWMSVDETEKTLTGMPSEAEWVIFNVQQTAFYRVNYDANNWNLLISQLKSDNKVIHTNNRAQLLDDSLNLARAGQLSYDVALDLLAYINNEDQYIPWDAALSSLSFIEQMFTRSGGYGSLKKYYLSFLEPLYNNVGFDDNLDDPLLEQYKRDLATTWVCKLDNQDCVQKSVDLFTQFMANPSDNSIISPNQKSTVYCTAIREGGETEWDFLWEQFLSSNSGTEKSRILSALGCSNEIWILSRYLDMAFDESSGIRKQDASRVFSAVSRNDLGRDLAWSYIQDQWDKVADYFGAFTTLGDLVTTVSNEFNTQQELHELELLKADHEDTLGTATRAINQAIEHTNNNIKWMTDNYDVIVQWLNDNGFGKKLKS